MRLRFREILVTILVGGLLLGQPASTWAETKCDNEPDDKKAECLVNLINEYEAKVTELQGKQRTLASTIGVLNNQIALTETQILATQQEIANLEKQIQQLSTKIGQLNDVLGDVSHILSARIEETYKRLMTSPVYYLFAANGFSDFLSRVQYLRSAQYHDRELLFTMEEARLNFDQQKTLKEEKQKELEVLKKRLDSQKLILNQQKASKQELLQVTKNDEQNFQNLLAKARAEFEAIQSILAGQGDETEVGKVNEGESIASIISGSSACSTGTHLHFEVAKNGVNSNPASWLKSQDVEWDLCGWYGCDEQFGFSGSWNWPVNGKPTVTQGYGMTAYAKSGAYGGAGHTGIDMVADNHTVKAVKEGTLYRGSISCGGGTLRYVKVEQNEGIATYYLHINYVK